MIFRLDHQSDARDRVRGTLRAPGAVLLVSCYELGHQPMAVASPLAFLRRAGFAPAVVDLAVARLDLDAVAHASLVAISAPMLTATRLGIRVAERVRERHPWARIAFYGLYAHLNADHLLEKGLADFVIGGEFEEPLVKLARALDATGEGEGIEGVRTITTPAAPYIKKFPLVAAQRDALAPLASYAKLLVDGEERLTGYVEASRGCKHVCTHCPITPLYGGRFFAVPVDVVMAEIRQLVAEGARHITFGDPDFFNGPTHAMRVADTLHAEFPGVTFDATIKIEHIINHRELIPRLASRGCLFVVAAVESLSDEVLDHLKKRHTGADVREAVAIVREAGLWLRPSLVPFSPWETLCGYLDILDFIDTDDMGDAIDPVQLSIRLLVPPGSALLNDPEMKSRLGAFNENSLSYTWTHPDPRMDALQRHVAAIVSDAADRGEDPAATYRRIRLCARAIAEGRNVDVRKNGDGATLVVDGTPASADEEAGFDLPAGRARPPRLSEAWFCCAEPTDGQLEPI
ncbi:B12-binding domain-containing radical SAM protein [bacterium]|nr:B12-binding domain-containing radical SAM protein [bacterium]